MNAERLFVELSHRLQDYDATVVLMLLLHWGLDTKPLACSLAQIARNDLGDALSRREVQYAVLRLRAKGLIATAVYANTKTEFRVNAEAVLALLREPVPNTPFFPGISTEPMPFLKTLELSQSGPATSPTQPTIQTGDVHV